MKKIALSLLLFTAITTYSQLKLGVFPNSIASGAIFQINGTASTGDYPGTFVFDGNGRVGIGTVTPGSNLDIFSNDTKTILALRNGTANAHSYFLNSQGGLQPSNPYVGAFFIWDGTANADRLIIYPNGNVGIGTGGIAFDSKFQVNGSIAANSVRGPSDKRFKKNIVLLKNSLSKICSLNGYNYEWRQSEFPDREFNKGKDMGLIAQEVEQVYPEVVFTASDEMKSKSIDYTKLIPALVESIKELKVENDTLRKEVEALKARLDARK
ncbi:MAG: hypothetical protein CFE23_15165 [Flavobacterium sp. BFFFF1]|uniref:tail fiber domain-containing protein n=1 Tax=Flavobacterium sp. BFFFF1 TaxID=2015557 RepID=UPI000BD8B3C2|nr:tail fiber domain-containing protein [Flavobacterium sp. BFFFF1]OYU79215.1 MAG: hypothetical protein CFE23_15165 [Flavobacterium sp. BFFFF1]